MFDVVAHATNNQGLCSHVAQVCNHMLYWFSMKPTGGGAPTGGKVVERMIASFGSYENFRKEFELACTTISGCGWVWLLNTPEGLKVVPSIGADTPLVVNGIAPVLAMGVWDNAYYGDSPNVCQTDCAVFLDHLVNWDFVNSQITN
jgi:Fe-Mn family superoxide dismutase